MRRLFLVLAAVAATGLALTTMLLRPAWVDEASYVDPGANLALGNGFVSSAWVGSPPHAVWGASNPGVPLLCAAWFNLLGFGLFQGRVLFFLVQVAGAILLVRWVARRYAIGEIGWLIAYLCCLFLPSLTGLSIYSVRPDAFALLLCAWFLSYSFPAASRPAAPLISPLLLGVATIAIGLHFSGYFALAAAAVFLARRDRVSFLAGVSLAAGLAIGLALLRLGYGSVGAWGAFVQARAAHYGRALPWVPPGLGKFWVSADLVIVAAACLALLVWEIVRARNWRSPLGRACTAGLAIFVLVPLAISTVGIYYSAYAWMVGVPLLLTVLPACMDRPWRDGKWVIVLVCVIVATCATWRARKIRSGWFGHAQRAEVATTLAELAAPGDAVAGSFDLFYELRGSGREVFFRVAADEGRSFGFAQSVYLPADDRARIRWIAAADYAAAGMQRGLGGEWEVVRRFACPPNATYGHDCVLLRRKP